ncbi:ParA family protein [Corticibacter populi]|uniref:ParA family protein n=1 Tax=Corticibacter populi TaxID=1550736 RepID=A0A3M6R0A3_9BURK|nr:ParA family protein [Corticibacter populi]RMX08232.1 ParA family protein [Corticibacter populi]RZS35506.1 chromosome partitioning related protein ParA [Corticibacter populi]
MFTLSVVATKGGVGKTTIAAHLAGLFRDIGLRVLLIDADVQPSLSKFFVIDHVAPRGLTDMITRGYLEEDCISTVQLPPAGFSGSAARIETTGHIDIVMSDTTDGRLQDWMFQHPDYIVRIRMAIKSLMASSYDIVIIDTQGAVGHLQDAAVVASDTVVAPASPDIISAREFLAGTNRLLERIQSAANLGLHVPPVKALLNRFENTNDSRLMTGLIRDQMPNMAGHVYLMETEVPSAVAFRKAATARVPVHWIDPHRCGDVMHRLMWELLPSLDGRYAPNHRNHSHVPGAVDAAQAQKD